MQKANRIAFVILAAVILGIVAWKVFYRPELSYKGKSLACWLELYTQGVGYSKLEVDEAVQSIGANACVRSGSVYILGKFHVEPKLVVPCLTNALYDPDKSVPCNAIWSLNQFGNDAKLAIPALVDRIYYLETTVSEAAINLLGRIHSEPKLVVPALIQALGADDCFVRRSAVFALKAFEREEKPAVTALLAQLKDPDPDLISSSIQTLGLIQDQPDLVVPALMEPSTIQSLGFIRQPLRTSAVLEIRRNQRFPSSCDYCQYPTVNVLVVNRDRAILTF